MKTYIVDGTVTVSITISIEAETEDDARDEAENLMAGGLDSFVGNGGLDKLVGTRDSNVSLASDDDFSISSVEEGA